MGDRTYVNLRILASQEKQAKELFNGEPDNETLGGITLVCGFEEVNYGNLPFLNKLRDAGIAYDSTWDAGSEYPAGTAYCRFTENGEVIEKSTYVDEWNPSLHSLMNLIDNPGALRNFIINHHETVTVAGLDENQVEYGKRYLAKKLIAPA